MVRHQMVCLALTPSEAAEMLDLLNRALNTLQTPWPVWVGAYLEALQRVIDHG